MDEIETAVLFVGAGLIAYALYEYYNGGSVPSFLQPFVPSEPSQPPDYMPGDYYGSASDLSTYEPTYPEMPSTAPDYPPMEPSYPMPQSSNGTGNLILFCAAIRDFEGKPGDLNYRNNNPGNIRSAPGVPSVSGYAQFPTWQAGWDYLMSYVQRHASSNPQWTFYDFFNMYAPSSDHNQPATYAQFVAGRCGVPATTSVYAFINGQVAVA